MSTFRMNDSVRSGAHELGEQWTVDRHLYLTEDKSRVVEEGDPDGRWLWAAPGRQVPMAQAKLLGAIRSEKEAKAAETDSDDEVEVDEEVEEAARAGEVADQVAQSTFPVAEDHPEDPEVTVESEEKQAVPAENKMVSGPEGDKGRPDAKTVRAWAKDNDVDVPAKGRIPDDVLDAYTQAHK